MFIIKNVESSRCGKDKNTARRHSLGVTGPYSPDLAPSDFRSFSKLEKLFRGK